ncbi:MAG: FliH/SctL family protein [Acidobacteriaceae bacterium]|nr:FliH/SctL family protein [Acidobacteriaceae bacterium]
MPVSVLMYRDVAAAGGLEPATVGSTHGDAERREGVSGRELEDLLGCATANAIAETEKRLRDEMEKERAEQAAKIGQAVALFQEERQEYFARVELEVVHLALAIAAKILHREAQVDPMLIAALVRMAVGKLHDGSSVSVRVPVGEAERWREALLNPMNGCSVEVVEDAHLNAGDCRLQTDLGVANFSMDAQLKEVEQGFFDLLAQRPRVR